MKQIEEYFNNFIKKTNDYHTRFSNLLKDPFYCDLWQGGISLQKKVNYIKNNQ
jgi:hypothetical protein